MANETLLPVIFLLLLICTINTTFTRIVINYVMVTGVYVDSPTDFVVDSRAIAKRDDGKVTCTITNPSGTKTENLITPLADGTYRISYTPFEEGTHALLFREISHGAGIAFLENSICYAVYYSGLNTM